MLLRIINYLIFRALLLEIKAVEIYTCHKELQSPKQIRWIL